MKTLEPKEIQWADSLGQKDSSAFLNEKETQLDETAQQQVEAIQSTPIDQERDVTVLNMASPIQMTLDLARTIEENAKRQAEINAIYDRSLLESRMEQLETRYTEGYCL